MYYARAFRDCDDAAAQGRQIILSSLYTYDTAATIIIIIRYALYNIYI